MANVPMSGTDIRLLSGVPFSNDYKHTRWFNSISEQVTYFNARNRVHSMAGANFQRIEGKNFVSCNASIDALFNTSYLMFRNSDYNDKWFYAFVTKLEYVQKNCTHVHFEIDVLQTWRFDYNFKPSFVAREHCPLWNSDGTPVINTIDEGLDYGTEYDVVGFDAFPPEAGIYWLVIVAKSLIHGNGVANNQTTEEKTNIIKATNIGSPQPLSYYVHPFKMDGTTPNVSIGGASKEISPITNVLSNIYSNEDAVNNIVSLYVTQHIGVDCVQGGSVNLNTGNFSLAMIADGESENIQSIYVEGLRSFESSLSESVAKYDKFVQVNESKLLMHPYAFAEMTDLAGNSFPIKLEYVHASRLQTIIKGSLGLSSKVAYQLDGYNLSNASNLSVNEQSRVGLQSGFINNNPQDVPIITDMLSAYLQGNRNSLQNQENSILFNGAMNVATSAISGVSSGGAVGAVAGATVGGIGGLGNTVLQLQGLQAKQQDINNVPPTLAKMGSNTAFDFGYYNSGFFIVKKQIKFEYRQRLTDYFKAFGYKVNRLKIPNLKTRLNWNYIQTVDCNITGNFGVDDLQKIKNIFNNGITLWHTNDIGNYDLQNGVI